MIFRNREHPLGVRRFALWPTVMMDVHKKLWLGFYRSRTGQSGTARARRDERFGFMYQYRHSLNDEWTRKFALLPVWTKDGYTVFLSSYMERYTGPKDKKYGVHSIWRREFHSWEALSLTGYLKEMMVPENAD